MIKKLKITVNGKTYDVEAEILDDPQPAAPAPAVNMVSPAAAIANPAELPQHKPVNRACETAGEVSSPIAGTVACIVTPENSVVAAGDVLLVIEAMKMNTDVISPCAGKVAKVNVCQGQNVEEGQTLMTLA